MRRILMRSISVLVGLASLTMTACADEASRPLTISSAPVALSSGEEPVKTLGKLVHRGTLKLTSPDKAFGGLSGLIVADDGARFLAITDSSHWLTGTLAYRDGKLSAATGVEIAPLLDLDGKPLSGKGGDAEGLTGSLDRDVFVSFERNHRIWRYSFGAQGLGARAELVPTPPELSGAPANSGLEGITLLSDGRLLALTEAFADSAGRYRGWLIGTDRAAQAAALSLKPRMPFELTDVRQLASGDVLTLERRFNMIGGVGFQMRRIALSSVAAGAVLDGEVVADAGMNLIIDNMEGLSVRQDADGRTLIYVVSDDNFNAPQQQTLIMMFELKD
jgi:hypothetical protein